MLRVLTMNVQHDAGDPRRTGLINRELRHLGPDLVVFQEVRWPDQLAELVAKTGLRHTTHQAELLDTSSPEAQRYGGAALATRWPHQAVEVLERRDDGFHWSVLAFVVGVPDLGELLLITPITPWQPEAKAVRERQAVALAEIDARHRRRLPTIVAGDLNAPPSAASIRYLTGRAGYRDAWAVAGEGPGHTWTVDNPLAAEEAAGLFGDREIRARIDYVFVGPGPHARIAAARLVGDRPVDGVWLSDHHGVLVDVEPTPAS